nr:MAG TPA: hypothetical protein [Caudoviricetes sp.]
MKVKLKKFDGVYADERKGYKAVSYDVINDTAVDGTRLGRVFLSLRLDKEKKEVGIENMLLIPCMMTGTTAHQISSEYDGLGYWFKTDNPKMCNTADNLRTNLDFIMEFAMKMISDVRQPPRVAMYVAGTLEPNMVDRSTVDKRYFTYEHNFCRYWAPKILSKKLMKLVETKPEPESKPANVRYIEMTRVDKDASHSKCEIDQSHPAIGPDDNDNPPGFIM